MQKVKGEHPKILGVLPIGRVEWNIFFICPCYSKENTLVVPQLTAEAQLSLTMIEQAW